MSTVSVIAIAVCAMSGHFVDAFNYCCIYGCFGLGSKEKINTYFHVSLQHFTVLAADYIIERLPM